MVPGEQGIATKESDMYQQKLVWSEGPLSVYEWSKLDLGAMTIVARSSNCLTATGSP